MSLVENCLKELKRDLDLVDERMRKELGGHYLSNRVHSNINKLLDEVSYFEKRNTEIPIEIQSIEYSYEGKGEIKFDLKENQDLRVFQGKRFKIVYLKD